MAVSITQLLYVLNLLKIAMALNFMILKVQFRFLTSFSEMLPVGDRVSLVVSCLFLTEFDSSSIRFARSS